MITKIQNIIDSSSNVIDDILAIPEFKKEFHDRLEGKRRIYLPFPNRFRSEQVIDDQYTVSSFKSFDKYSFAIWDMISYSQPVIVFTGSCYKSEILKNVEKWIKLEKDYY